MIGKMTSRKLAEVENYAIEHMKKSLDPQHDLSHVQRVRRNALRIVKVLGLKDVDINLLQAACLLHDLTYAAHKWSVFTYLFEGKYIRKILLSERNELALSDEEFSVVLDADEHHPLSYPFRLMSRKMSPYCKILQDADTLDFFSSKRLTSLKKMGKTNLFRRLGNFFAGKLAPRFYKGSEEKYLNYPEVAQYFMQNV